MRFGIRGKLAPYFIGSYEIMERIGPVAYSLALPPELAKIHNVFQVSRLRNYMFDLSYVISAHEIVLRPNLSYEEEPIKIMARDVKELRRKSVSLVKVLWRNHAVIKET